MTGPAGGAGQLPAVSDLHLGYAENRAPVERMAPGSDDDRLLVAGTCGSASLFLQPTSSGPPPSCRRPHQG